MNMTDDGIWLQFACAALSGYIARPDTILRDADYERIGWIADGMLALWKERERVREPPKMTPAEIVAETLDRR